MLYRFNLLLAFALVLIVAMLAFVRVDHSRPNYQVMLGDDMTYSPAYSAFTKNPNFANGRTLQEPVPGTIARGAQTFHFESTPQEALRAGEELVNPFSANAEDAIASAERGAEAFKTFCVSCHGGDATGNGPVAKRGFPPPPSLLVGKSRQMKDGHLLHILTYGQNSMPQFAAQLTPSSRWDVINHIRLLQQKAPLPPEPADPAPALEPEEETASEDEQQEAAPLPEDAQNTQPDSDSPEQVDTETQP